MFHLKKTPDTILRVYVLYRVSTKKQVDKQKDDIPMQRIACHQFAKDKGWVIVKEFYEKGVSGFKVSANDRDAIQDLKDAAAKKEFDVLLVYMFDRIGRIDSETPFVVEWFIKQGIQVWSTQEGQQKLEDQTDKLMNYIRFWQANGESQKTSMRLKTRMAQLTEAGIYHGGTVPYGYTTVNNGRMNKKGQPVKDISVVTEEAEIVVMIFDKTLYEGYGSHRLAEYVNSMGIRTHNVSKFTSTTINRILRNRLYCGYYVSGETVSNKIPELVIVDENIFDSVQEILDQRSHKNEHKHHIAMTTKGKALLSGNIFCGHCGCHLNVSGKFINKLIILLFVLVVSTGISSYAETVETILTVDENSVIKSSTKDMLGINGNWYSERLLLGGNSSTDISDEYISAVNGLNIPIVLSRMSGADSQYFNWKESLGTVEERSSGNLGIAEWIKAHQKANPNVGLTFTINIIEDTLEDHKDLVRFLTLMPDDPDAVGSDGINWAQKRVNSGIPAPVNIKTFELGNETYYDYVDGCLDNIEVNLDDVSAGVTEYVEDCIEIIAAMKSVNSDISFTASCFTYTKKTGDDAKLWNEYLVNNLAGKIDYVAYHEYYYNYNFYWYAMQLDQYLYQYINKLEPEKRPKIYHSEYGYWMSGYDLNELKNGTSLYGTLINAKFLNNIINMPLIEMASIHVTHERISTEDFWRTGWDLFRIYDDGKIYCTVPTEMLKIFDKALGNGGENENVVSVELSGNMHVGGYGNFSDAENTPAGALTASAHTTSDNGVNIILVNGDEDITHNISFEFNNEYRLAEKYILTSQNLSDNNLKGHDDTVYMKAYAVNSAEKLVNYTIEPKSIVVLKCVPLDDASIADDCNIIFYNQTGEVDGIAKVNNKFAFTCEFMQDSFLASTASAYCAVLNNGVSVQEFFDSENSLENLCWFDGIDIKRNIGYCNVALSDELPSGKYTAIVGLLEDNKYVTVDFYLDNSQYSKNVQINDVVSNNEVTAHIQFNGFETADKCKVVVQRQSYTAHIDIITVPQTNSISYTFAMPYDAIAGEYEIKVSWDGGEYSQVFNYEKSYEFLKLSGDLTNQNGDIITLSNLKDSNCISFKVSNKTDTDLTAYFYTCLFNSEGKLLATYSSCETLIDANKSDADVSIVLDELQQYEDIDAVKVFVWDKNNIQPYLGVYYIK